MKRWKVLRVHTQEIIDDEKRTNSLRNVNTVSGLDFVEIIANRIAGAKIKKDFNGNKNISSNKLKKAMKVTKETGLENRNLASP